ncbi:MAG: hypothetical protein U0M23_04155 [Acutalibacteraceae bacterium]|nr:hypothetical protein [Acutalibacteraceae bacterium]
MMREEFEQRTGFYPTQELYQIIEKDYMTFEGDKDTFCKAYKKNADGMAEKIQREADIQKINARQEVEKAAKEYEAQITELEKALECEQEWKPYEDTDNVPQADYEKLADCSDTKRMSDEEAKDLLYDWYGFAKEKIRIHHSVPVYEVNRHGRLRKVGKLDRSPLYNATDWNYIRFDCGCMSYELKNDSLRPFVH